VDCTIGGSSRPRFSVHLPDPGFFPLLARRDSLVLEAARARFRA